MIKYLKFNESLKDKYIHFICFISAAAAQRELNSSFHALLAELQFFYELGGGVSSLGHHHLALLRWEGLIPNLTSHAEHTILWSRNQYPSSTIERAPLRNKFGH